MTRKEEREYLFAKTNGRCGYCGCALPPHWHVDHIRPVIRMPEGTRRAGMKPGDVLRPELDVLENKMASCPKCNIRKGSYSLEDFRADIEGCLEGLNERTPQYKLAKRFGLIEERPRGIVFYFEYMAMDLDTRTRLKAQEYLGYYKIFDEE